MREERDKPDMAAIHYILRMVPPGQLPDNDQVARLLAELRDGDATAFDQLFPLVYAELRRAADILLNREGLAYTLQPTALVHEVYLKLARGAAPQVSDRAHFIGVAARAMRQILVDHARRRNAAKRGHGETFVTLGDQADAAAPGADAETMLALDEALAELALMDERLAKVVELRFFGGLTEEEVAVALGVTARTVQRDWVKARAWLHAKVSAA